MKDAQVFWDERFAADGYRFGTEPNRFLKRHAELLPPAASALCVADGEGRNSVWLAQQGLQVTAFDISPKGVAKARTLAQERGVGVDFRICAAEDWCWEPERYDVVAAIFIQFAEPALRAEIFRGIRSTLRTGGLLLLQGYAAGQLAFNTGGPGKLDQLYTVDLLRRSFDDWEVVELREYETDLEEGSAHVGRSAVIDLVARKA